jgi:hypothetical protein
MAATTPQTFDYIYELAEADICNLALARIGADRIRDTVENTKQANSCRSVYAATRDELIRQYPWNFAMRSDLLLQDTAYPYAVDEGKYAFIADGRYAVTSGVTATGTGWVVIPTVTNPATLDNSLVGRRIIGTNVRPNTTIVAVDNTAHTITIDRGTASYNAGVYTPAAGSAFTILIALEKILSIDFDTEAVYETAGGDNEKRILTDRVSGYTMIGTTKTYYLAVKYLRQILNPAQFDPVFRDALVLRIASKIALTMTRQSGIVGAIQQEFAAIMQSARFTSSEERMVDEVGDWWTNRQVSGGPSTRNI